MLILYHDYRILINSEKMFWFVKQLCLFLQLKATDFYPYCVQTRTFKLSLLQQMSTIYHFTWTVTNIARLHVMAITNLSSIRSTFVSNCLQDSSILANTISLFSSSHLMYGKEGTTMVYILTFQGVYEA